MRYLILKFQIFLHRRRHDSHLLNGNKAQMMSQLQYQNQVEVFSLYNSEIHKHSQFKFSGIIVFLSSNQNKLITLLPCQSKKQRGPFNLAAETAIIAQMESI